MLAVSFTEKNVIRIHLKPRMTYSEFVESQLESWQSTLDEGLSFVIKDKGGRIVGVCLNYYFDFEPEQKPHNGDITSDFNEYFGFVTRLVR